ncbi:MAG: DUF438 domain-containing protein [Myxococcota bacterium]
MSEAIDNRAHRIREMKRVLLRLHRGEDVEDVKREFEAVVQSADPSEVAVAEQELLAEGVSAAELMEVCDLHSAVVADSIDHSQVVPAGHPVDVFRRENEAIAAQVNTLRHRFAEALQRPEQDEVPAAALVPVREAFQGLMDLDKHYARKENLLFPILERHGITGPSTVMWGKDDQARALLRAVGNALQANDAAVAEWRVVQATVVAPALEAVLEMIRKEERILLPMALQTLSDSEWAEIWRQSPEIGWCLVDPGGPYAGVLEHEGPDATQGEVVFPTGAIRLEELKAIFSVLPVDLTFVDADDRVRFFTEGADRVFVRPKAIIGRKVEHCHPPSSVHVVQEILSDFRSCRQSVAAFWVEHRGRFVHIRYFALRDERGTYLGTLEVTQDLTEQRALRGERRLLSYE